jgi:hypothetical protein
VGGLLAAKPEEVQRRVCSPPRPERDLEVGEARGIPITLLRGDPREGAVEMLVVDNDAGHELRLSADAADRWTPRIREVLCGGHGADAFLEDHADGAAGLVLSGTVILVSMAKPIRRESGSDRPGTC